MNRNESRCMTAAGIKPFRIETDRMEAVCRQTHHILFPACDKEQITLCRQLLQPETVVVAKITGIQEPHL